MPSRPRFSGLCAETKNQLYDSRKNNEIKPQNNLKKKEAHAVVHEGFNNILASFLLVRML